MENTFVLWNQIVDSIASKMPGSQAIYADEVLIPLSVLDRYPSVPLFVREFLSRARNPPFKMIAPELQVPGEDFAHRMGFQLARDSPPNATYSLNSYRALPLTMAVFNDLAIELQEAIWQLVLPTSRGVHWIEVEGIPQDPEFIRGSIRMTQWYKFDRMPETLEDVMDGRRLNPEIDRRADATQESSPFFSDLLTTVPAIFGQSGSGLNESGELEDDLADEIAYTSRCRQLSTYYQIATLLSLCRLSRSIAQWYIQDSRQCSWPIWRSMGSLYRPRPIDVWEAVQRRQESTGLRELQE
ncbi:hypothetical protein EJ07DRAFT_153710 [Lizonia empirigonia]|nr:hypothetical protein EJ07DRAFT_153710 [Lizonia empirigonia]